MTKISEYTPIGAPLSGESEFDVSFWTGTEFVTRSITATQLIAEIGGGGLTGTENNTIRFNNLGDQEETSSIQTDGTDTTISGVLNVNNKIVGDSSIQNILYEDSNVSGTNIIYSGANFLDIDTNEGNYDTAYISLARDIQAVFAYGASEIKVEQSGDFPMSLRMYNVGGVNEIRCQLNNTTSKLVSGELHMVKNSASDVTKTQALDIGMTSISTNGVIFRSGVTTSASIGGENIDINKNNHAFVENLEVQGGIAKATVQPDTLGDWDDSSYVTRGVSYGTEVEDTYNPTSANIFHSITTTYIDKLVDVVVTKVAGGGTENVGVREVGSASTITREISTSSHYFRTVKTDSNGDIEVFVTDPTFADTEFTIERVYQS